MDSGKRALFLLLAAVLTVVLLISGCAQDENTAMKTATKVQVIEDITVEQAFALLQENSDNPDFVLLDVRTPAEFEVERIESAIMLDYYSENFREALDELDKSKTYLIYCRSGRRTGETLQMMKELGFDEVYNMLGGINSWKSKGFPTIKKEAPNG